MGKERVMDALLESMEGMRRQELVLLEELIQCLAEERESLIHMNVEKLWTLLVRKQDVFGSLEQVHTKIREIQEKGGLEGRVPSKERRPLTALAQRARLLKEEIKARVKENVVFIRETLCFIDELVRSLTHSGSLEYSYNPAKNGRREASARIFHREV